MPGHEQMEITIKYGNEIKSVTLSAAAVEMLFPGLDDPVAAGVSSYLSSATIKIRNQLLEPFYQQIETQVQTWLSENIQLGD